MTLLRTLLLAAALAAGLTSAPALADPPRRGPDRASQTPRRGPDRASEAPRRDADRAFQAIRQGRSMPLPQLEQRVMPLMGGADYLGPELNGSTYRFKFIQNGRVIWVDVDGQGRIVRRSRNQ
jgi:hypothetical protein